MTSLEVYILHEIAENNCSQLSHEKFGVTKNEFDEAICHLKTEKFIGGNAFTSNGVLKETYNFFYLFEKGERYLRTGRIV